MEKKLKVFLDVEIADDVANSELQNRFGRLAYSYQACGCGGCGGCGRYTATSRYKNEHTQI